MSRTLSGLFLVGALSRPRKSKRTNRENPRTIPEQIRKIPENRESPKKDKKRTKKEGHVQIGKPPRLKPPRLAALDFNPVVAPTIRFGGPYPKDPAVLKCCDVLIHHRRINSLSVEISCVLPPGKQGVSETLPYYFATVVFFPTTVVN